MLRSLLERIMVEYPHLRGTTLSKDHPLFSTITLDLPTLLRPASSAYPHFVWQGSVGKGQWADAPWLAVFDPVVTDTAQLGYYPVYLFSGALDAVYLSMNQGMTLLRKEYTHAEEARQVLRQRAALIRTRLRGKFEYIFPLDKIDLKHSGPSSRLAFYEPGHAFGCCYRRGEVPRDGKLLSDAEVMVGLYAQLTQEGGTTELAGLSRDSSVGSQFDEARKYTYHRRIERNRKLVLEAKKIHGHKCQACGFDFSVAYGDLGSNYIEAHHRVPLWQLAKNGPLRLDPRKDFAVVCANCHRMLHQSTAPASFEDFVAHVRKIRMTSEVP